MSSTPDATTLQLTIGYLYPDLMNTYGDRGNVLCLQQRAAWRGLALRLQPIGLGERLDWRAFDLIFAGGAQDRQQKLVADDLIESGKGEALRAGVEEGLVVLAVCGAYQLFARAYRPAEGPELPGIGLFEAETVHKGHQVPRCIGNVVVEWNGATLVGFENHGGRTYLASGAGSQTRPLGRVLVGSGNNAEDRTEGAVYRTAFGTYLHGSLLPKNPHFADHLLQLALTRRYGPIELPALDDRLEWQAHEAAVKRAKQR